MAEYGHHVRGNGLSAKGVNDEFFHLGSVIKK